VLVADRGSLAGMGIEALAPVVGDNPLDQARPSPHVHRGGANVERASQFLPGEKPVVAESIIATPEAVGFADPPNCEAVWPVSLSGAEPTLIQQAGDFGVGVVFKQLIDLGNHMGIRLLQLPGR